jgi:hypothetical protein
MIKKLKIAGENIPVKYKEMHEDDAGEYLPEEGVIVLRNDLKADEHDETIIHEIVHVVEHCSSLRHVRIPAEVWEIIAGEVGRAVADNFILIPKK